MKAETLKSGFMDKGLFYRTDEGTQQGGVISPTLMLMTLTGGVSSLIASIALLFPLLFSPTKMVNSC